MSNPLPRYDTSQTYHWNYEHAPEPVNATLENARIYETIAVPGSWTCCGLPVDSPLGIPAGPLLNGKWVLYYANLGFDVLTYKTVRSIQRECYPLPNLQPVACQPLTGIEVELPATQQMDGSWAVSFGMPSMTPKEWRADVEATRQALAQNKLLSVSVVGSVQPGWTLDQLAQDYATCARWAMESGADCIETNLSCPNVSTCDGQLYQQPEHAGIVAAAVRDAIGQTPFIAKIGHVTQEPDAIRLLESLVPHVNAIALTNSVAATVRNVDGKLLFDGARRGICGDATRQASVVQTKLFSRIICELKCDVRLIGIGGIRTAAHVHEYLNAGAEATQIATAAMVDPSVGLQIRQGLGFAFAGELG